MIDILQIQILLIPLDWNFVFQKWNKNSIVKIHIQILFLSIGFLRFPRTQKKEIIKGL